MQRRNFLKIAGGGVILAAGGATAFSMSRTPTKALAPWQQAGDYDDPRLRALSYAILAPNPHNMQPWIVELTGTDGVTLRFDQARQLPHTDPYDRQLTIGLGCFLEMLQLAARADGYACDVTLFPEGVDAKKLDSRPVATIQFHEGQADADPLWAHVPLRRSNKEPFDTTSPVPQADFAAVLATTTIGRLGGSIAPDDIAYWRDLTAQALTVEIETPRTYKESVDVFRIGKREVNASPDGIDFSGVTFETMAGLGLFSRDVALDTSSIAYTQGRAAVLANTTSAMGHLWLVTPGNSRLDQIATGADWLRVNLACTAHGLGFQPLSQALQEYPEMAALYAETHAKLAPDGGTVQMLARIGYGPEVKPSPRWPIEAKLVSV